MSGELVVEIRKANFVNKGAELMLLSVLQKMREVYPDAKFVMEPTIETGLAPYSKRIELSLFQKAHFVRFSFDWGRLVTHVPHSVRETYGVIIDKEVNVVLDTAGFAYGDQWGEFKTCQLASACKRWKENGTKLILLPQSFGPFSTTKIINAIKEIVEYASFVFPREQTSYDYLVEAVGTRENVKVYPDFTCLMGSTTPACFHGEGRVCVVPNSKMVDMTSEKESEAYLPFMVKCVKCLIEKGLNPFLLIHEGVGDLFLAEKIKKEVGSVEIIKQSDPRQIKGIIGDSYATIGSRYHGLASALSQKVPSLATGWSHKYVALLKEYDVPNCLLNVKMTEFEIEKKIDMLVNPLQRKEIITSLKRNSTRINCETNNMWKDVFDVIDRSHLGR